MNREHDIVARNFVSPDATPASTWNRGNAYRHLALAGWDPNGLSERDHLLQAVKYLEDELDRVDARDRLQKEEKPQDVTATWGHNHLSPIAQLNYPAGVRSNFANDPEVMFDSVGRKVQDAETHLPGCPKCGTELIQDPANSYKPTCPNGECILNPKLPQQTLAPQPANGTIRGTYAPVPMDRPQSPFQRYQNGPTDITSTQRLDIMRTLRAETGENTTLMVPVDKTDPEVERVLRESLEQGADEEPSK